MKKILVPVDFSEQSEYALQVAATLAKKQNAAIVVMHMMGLSEAVLTKDESKEVFEAMFYLKLAEKRFKEFLDKDYLQGIELQTTVQNYKEFHEINAVAKEFEADLIVMGSQGSSGLKEAFVGSNTEKVVRTSEIPVLVIKNQLDDFKIEKVVFACDFTKDYIAPFQQAWKFFETLGVQPQLLFINLPSKFVSTSEMEIRAFQFLQQAELYSEAVYDSIVYYNDFTIEDGIFSFSDKYDADVIAVPTHGRRGLAHFFSENIGEALVNHSITPMMTFKI